jgi:ATP-dependent exoDNAse (exonuclease V) beta subunit
MADGTPVVWWDPAVLVLDVEEQAPLRQQRILEVDPDGAAAAASEQNYIAWKTERAALLARASQPLLSVETVTSLARRDAVKATEGGAEELDAPTHPRVVVEKVERGDHERPGGRRFGALVHAILASVDLNAGGSAIQASAAINGRILGATEEEIDGAVAAVGGALSHPILRRAAASAEKGGLRREAPVLFTLDDGSLAEGVVDLAFREDALDFAGWVVVDFKTDREFEASSARYITQVRVYSEAISAATSSPTRGTLLVV